MAASVLSPQLTARLADDVEGLLQRHKSTEESTYPNGISLLGLKNDLMLSYLNHLAFICLVKAEGSHLADHQAIVEEVVRLRVILDKIRPLENKLKPQIEKLVQKAAEATAKIDEEVDEMDVAMDPLAFRPNPGNLVNGGDAHDSDASRDSDEGGAEEGASSGLYRPPRVAPVPYHEPVKGKKRAAVDPSASLVAELANEIGSSNPYLESATGLSVAPTLGSKRADSLREMERYEEENMTRLFMSKKEHRKRLADEEDVALGGSASQRAGGQRGGYSDLNDFVGQLGKRSKRSANEYQSLRGMKRVKPIAQAEESGLGGGVATGAGRFDKAVKRSKKRSRR